MVRTPGIEWLWQLHGFEPMWPYGCSKRQHAPGQVDRLHSA